MSEPQSRPTSSHSSPLRWALVVLGACLLCTAALLCWPRSQTFYTDATAIKEPTETAKVRDILWQPPRLLADAVNAGEDDYEPRISADGMTLYFVRGKAGENADIYYCNRIPGGWTEARPLEAINSESDDLGPEPSSDLQTLYFYSNRPGGHGGYDLWAAYRVGDTWRAPVNLGPAVNSAFNEYGPAISAQHNRLYFASNRPGEEDQTGPQPDAWPATVREDLYFRDYDLYVSRLSDDAWTEAAPAHALNTPYNEGTPALSPAGDFLYFSSDRPAGAGGFDLYRARLLKHQPQAPDHLGWTVNSPANDLDPALSLDGFGLYFSSDRQRGLSAQAEDYNLYYTASREVFVDAELSSTAFTWSAFLQHVLPNLLWALLLCLLLLMLLWLLRGEFYRRLSLIMRCLLISLMLHFALLLIFMVWQVSTRLAELQQQGGVKVALLPPAGSSDIARQLRGGLTDVAQPQVPAANLPQKLMQHAVSHVRTRADLEVPANQQEPTDTSLAEPLVRESHRADVPMVRRDREVLEPADAHLVRPDVLPEQLLVTVREAVLQSQLEHAATAASEKLSPDLAHLAPTILVEMETVSPRRPLEDRSRISPVGFQEPRDTAPDPPMSTAWACEVVTDHARTLVLRTPELPQRGPDQRRESSWSAPAPPAGTPLRRLAVSGPPQEEPPNAGLTQLSPEPTEVATIDESIMTTDLPSPSERGVPASAVSTFSTAEATTDVAEHRFPEPSLPEIDGEQIAAEIQAGAADVVLPAQATSLKRVASSPGPQDVSAAITTLDPESRSARDRRSLAALEPADTDHRRPVELPSDTPSAQAPSLPALELNLALPAELVASNEAFAHREPAQRKQLVEDLGGSAQTEHAVSLALQWLAQHQSPDGRWDGDGYDSGCGACPGKTQIQVDNALTGLALLCFLTAGHTHTTPGPYQEQIERAVNWLLRQQDGNGDLRGKATMYSQAIATMALAEALGMTGDPRLTDPVQRAAAFIVRARNRSVGGWRYDPGQYGDTSVLGWQVMALRSAEQAGVDVAEEAYDSARQWLDRVSSHSAPGLYAYQPGRGQSPSMTAEALFAQHLLGRSREERRMQQSARYIMRFLPDWDSKPNTYFWYYATLALHQQQGPHWQRWNEVLLGELLDHQHQTGPSAGSWDLTDRWSNLGGRIYQTAMCTLMLEVYYRYLPLYLSADRDGGPDERYLSLDSE